MDEFGRGTEPRAAKVIGAGSGGKLGTKSLKSHQKMGIVIRFRGIMVCYNVVIIYNFKTMNSMIFFQLSHSTVLVMSFVTIFLTFSEHMASLLQKAAVCTLIEELSARETQCLDCS